jgi:1-deoxy-D-xylulose 5-phosphate reductoisomerase
MEVPLLRKVTVPVAVPEDALTEAVKVTESPAVTVVRDCESDVVVLATVGAAALTVSVAAVEVEVLKLELPVNLAVMV